MQPIEQVLVAVKGLKTMDAIRHKGRGERRRPRHGALDSDGPMTKKGMVGVEREKSTGTLDRSVEAYKYFECGAKHEVLAVPKNIMI